MVDATCRARSRKSIVSDRYIRFSALPGSPFFFQKKTDDTVRIDVRDTGIGIASEDRECVFQPFVQADTRLGTTVSILLPLTSFSASSTN